MNPIAFDACFITEPAITDLIIPEIPFEKLPKSLQNQPEWQLISQATLEQHLQFLEKNAICYTAIPGGQLANTAHNITHIAQKINPKFIPKIALACLIGKDKDGEAFANQLKNYGIDLTYSKFTNEVSNKCLSLKIQQPQTAEIQKSMLTYISPTNALQHISNEIFIAICKKTRYLFFEGYLFPKHSARIIELVNIANQVKQNINNELNIGITLSSESAAKSIPLEWAAQNLDVIAGNREEFGELFNIHKKLTFNNIHHHLNQYRHKYILCTQGSQGVYITHPTLQPSTQIFELTKLDNKKIVDVTGAGDTFLAGILYGLITQKNIIEILPIAHFFAQQIIQQQGARLGL